MHKYLWCNVIPFQPSSLALFHVYVNCVWMNSTTIKLSSHEIIIMQNQLLNAWLNGFISNQLTTQLYPSFVKKSDSATEPWYTITWQAYIPLNCSLMFFMTSFSRISLNHHHLHPPRRVCAPVQPRFIWFVEMRPSWIWYYYTHTVIVRYGNKTTLFNLYRIFVHRWWWFYCVLAG